MLFIKFVILLLVLVLILYYSFYISSGNTWDAHWEITCGKLRRVNHLKNGLRLEEGLFLEDVFDISRRRYFIERWYFPIISKFDTNSIPFLIFRKKPFYINHYITLKFERKRRIKSYSLFFKENITRHLLSSKSYKKINKFYSQKLLSIDFNNKKSLYFIVRSRKSYDPFFYSNFWNKHRSNCLYVDVSWIGYQVTFK